MIRMSDAEPLPVLIVDDDPSILALLEVYLREAGRQVYTAAGGEEALTILNAHAPPIVVTDWSMPGLSGLDLCRTIRSQAAVPFAYIILHTAHSTAEDNVVEALEAGADEYLTKPCRKRELLARVRSGERVIRLQMTTQQQTREAHRANAEIAIAHARLAEAHEKLRIQATTDELTGLINRREGLAQLETAWSASVRQDAPLTCAMIDVDHFKKCNDTYGHNIGDIVLRDVAQVFRESVRRHEPLCRIGGEEFLVIMPGATIEDALRAGQRFCRAVEGHEFCRDELTIRMTISIGLAQRTPVMTGTDDLLMAADQALYAAKRNGRNRVETAPQENAQGEPPVEGAGADRTPASIA